MVCAARSAAGVARLPHRSRGKPTINSTSGLVYRRPPPWQPHAEREPPPWRRDVVPAADRAAEKLAREQLSWRSLPKTPLRLHPVETGLDPACVPPLAHGLDVVLRESGVHPIMPIEHQTPDGMQRTISGELRQRVALHKIAQPDEIDWARIPPYVRASEDATLRETAGKEPGVRYSASTSSITKAFSVLYHAVSNFRDTCLRGGLTSRMSELPSSFTKHHNKPAALLVWPYPRASDGSDSSSPLFSIDSQEGLDRSPAILRDLGHSMERMLTMSGPEFEENMLLRDGACAAEPVGNEGYMDASSGEARARDHPPQFYHYSRADSFLLRAQIDCRDPVTGNVFDLKTRAVAAVRYNIWDYRANSDCKLRRLTGTTNSYEREFYDMVRSVFLKYALQLRIGRMSGAFVTYHNTSRVLGFEFLSLSEMEAYIFGNEEWAKTAFSLVVRIMGMILDEVTADMQVLHPGFLKVVMAPRPTQRSVDIYVQRVQAGQEDPLGPASFKSTHPERPNTSEGGDDLATAVLTNLPSKTRPVGPQGESLRRVTKDSSRSSVAYAGGDSILSIATLPMPMESNGNNEKRKTKFDRRKFAQSVLVEDVRSKINPVDLRCWNLRMAPCVNGKATRMAFQVGPADVFELKYYLGPGKCEGDPERLLRDFVQVLDEAYD